MDDLHQLGEDLITTSARMVRWTPTHGVRLSLAAARILARLLDNGPTRISYLAEQEHCSQPTITNHIKRLEAAGLVERALDPHDARAWRITLTAAGHQELATMRRLLGASLEPYLAHLSGRDRKALRDGIEAMRRLMALDRLPG